MSVRIQLEAAHVDEPALGIAPHRVLHLDDVGAPVGEDRSCRGNEGELRNLEDAYAVHHLDHGLNVTGSAVGERNGCP